MADKSLSKLSIFQATDKQVKAVSVAEWGGVVYTFKPSAALKLQWAKYLKENKSDSILDIARFLCVFLCDENGDPLFQGFNADGTFSDNDASQLMTKDYLVLDRLFDEVAAYHKPPRNETLKNSESGPIGDSTSSLPATSA